MKKSFESIFFEGLNCHLSSIINIVSTLTEHFDFAFSTLWSEFDFDFDQKHDLFISRRIFENLKNLGIEIVELLCANSQQTKQYVENLEVGQYFFVGMDRFFVPWDAAFGGFHENHFFVAKKHALGVLCFDPVYLKNFLPLTFDQLFKHTFTIGTVKKTHDIAQKPVNVLAVEQAYEIKNNHPLILQDMSSQIERGLFDAHVAVMLSKKVFALTINRRMFNRFLGGFFDQHFLLQWVDLKNGLLKLSLKPSKALVQQLLTQLETLLNVEVKMAERLLV